MKKVSVIEKLEAMGQKDEKEGIRWTKYFMDLFDQKEMEHNQLKQAQLKKKRLTKRKYYEAVAQMLNEQMQTLDKPSNKWRVLAFFTENGVVAQIVDIYGRAFQRAFKPCGIPKYDLHMVNTYLGMAEDTMYKFDQKTKSGIILQ